MSFADRSQSMSDSALLLQLPLGPQRPLTSHAWIEKCGLLTKREPEISNLLSLSRKSFLPPLTTTNDNNQSVLITKLTDSDTYRQKMWAGQSNIVVTVRLRPLSSHDQDRMEIVQVVENKEIVVSQANARLSARRNAMHRLTPRHVCAFPAQLYDRMGTRRREKRYAFDHVFAPQDDQQKVYEHTTKFLIHGILNGFNATVFAYGCTGAGKTYTMLGTQNEPGIMARTLHDLFQSIERVHQDPTGRIRYRITVSFLEVYNENIRDLLSASSSCSSASTMPSSEFLELREDPIRGIIVAGLMEVEAKNAQDVMKLLRRGNKYRSQESTAANALSSRSHAVLQVYIEQQESLTAVIGDNNIEVKFGKLSLVDLAGSERAAVTQNRGQRLLEGANINRSLLALGNCINALGEKRGSFVPYRDSKLTRLLKDSLGGNCRTVMIANVSLAASSLIETLNTLKYANRAKNIKTTIKRNMAESDSTSSDQSHLVASLRKEIATLKKALFRQQEQAESNQKLPVQSKLRWAPKKNIADERTLEMKLEETYVTAKLLEARRYITESFQRRRTLRYALMKLEHQIQRQAQDAICTYDSTCCTSADNEPQPQVSTQPLSNGSTTVSSPFSAEVGAHPCNENCAHLIREKEKLLQHLARNERALNEFHQQVAQSPLLEGKELVHEILSMEYRIGHLETDNLQLEMLRDSQMQVDGNLVRQQGHHMDHNIETLDQSIASDEPEPPSLDSRARGFNDSKQIHLPTVTPTNVGITEKRASLTERQDHSYPTSCSAHPTAVSLSTNIKPWGFHLANASLSCIRSKKKSPMYSTRFISRADGLALGKTQALTNPQKAVPARSKHSKNKHKEKYNV